MPPRAMDGARQRANDRNRLGPKRLRVALLLTATGLAACNALFGIDELTYDQRAAGGSTGGGEAGSTPDGGPGGGGGGSAHGGAAGSAAGGGSVGGQGGSGGAAGAGGGVLASCDEQYGTAPGYLSCSETADECRFVARVTSQSCGAICASLGGECQSAMDNVTGSCTGQSELACADASGHFDDICICSRGCGAGPACESPEQCTAGVCQ